MKARTRIQKEVEKLYPKLPKLTDKQKKWALENIFNAVGFLCKKKIWCSECGTVFDSDSSSLIVEVTGDCAVCPKCGAELELMNSRKLSSSRKEYFSIITTFKGFQVIRHFIACKYSAKAREKHIFIDEAVQIWIDVTGNDVVVARPLKGMFSKYYDDWNFCKPMEIRGGDCSDMKYNIFANYIYPYMSVLPIIRRNGFKYSFHGISPSDLFRTLLTDNYSEMLFKTKQYDMLGFYLKCYGGKKYQFAINICNRNKYIIKDASMWVDYVALLEYFHLDVHNACYVCPKNLKKEHDRLFARKRRIELKIELERKISEAKKWEDKYKKDKGKFFGICFGDDDIIITVVSSVAEMAEEGIAMHHCVYSMGYYKKPYSLILSAKDKNGNRIETIEVSLKTFKIVQSRGVCNSNTDKHDKIVNLVNQNMNLIRLRSGA